MDLNPAADANCPAGLAADLFEASNNPISQKRNRHFCIARLRRFREFTGSLTLLAQP
jgi:hypothetical protein